MTLTMKPSASLASMLTLSIVLLLLSLVNATPAAAATSIYACVNNSSGTIHIVGASAPCATNEILLVWNISGTNGTNHTNGTDGTSVTFAGYFAGNDHGCPNGGAIFAAGGVNAYVCNGTNGQGSTRADGCGYRECRTRCVD